MPLDADDLHHLRIDLRSEDPDVRAKAVERASEAIDATVMSIVAQALLSENPEVRERAVALIDTLAELAEG